MVSSVIEVLCHLNSRIIMYLQAAISSFLLMNRSFGYRCIVRDIPSIDFLGVSRVGTVVVRNMNLLSESPSFNPFNSLTLGHNGEG